MIGIDVPKKFEEMVTHCFVAVPVGGSFSGEGHGYENGFASARVVRDLYKLWKHLHAKAAGLSKVPRYYSCHNEDEEVKHNCMTFAQREIITILNCKFAHNATFEWWEHNEKGEFVRTNGFDWLPTPELTSETLQLLAQPGLVILFDEPEHNLNKAYEIWKRTMEIWKPASALVEQFDYIRPGEYRLFAPLLPMMKGDVPVNGFVPYISSSSRV